MDHLSLHCSNRLSLLLSSSLWSHFQTRTGVGQSTGRVGRGCRRTWVGVPHAFDFGGNKFIHGALHLEYTFVAKAQGWVNKPPSTSCPYGAWTAVCGLRSYGLSMSSTSEEAKSKQQKDVEEYLSKIKLREVFQVYKSNTLLLGRYMYIQVQIYLAGFTAACD